MILNKEALNNLGIDNYTNHCKFCYPLGDNPSGSSFRDISGRGHHLSIGTAPVRKGIKNGGQVSYFNGSSSYLYCARSSDFDDFYRTTYWTLLWWEKHTDATAVSAILNVGNNAGTKGLYMKPNNTTGAFSMNMTDTTNTWINSTSTSLYSSSYNNVWRMIAVCGNNGTFSLYINGKNYAVSSSAGGSITHDIGVEIGCREYSPSTRDSFFDGSLRYVMGFSGGALTQEQIKAIYDATYIE